MLLGEWRIVQAVPSDQHHQLEDGRSCGRHDYSCDGRMDSVVEQIEFLGGQAVEGIEDIDVASQGNIQSPNRGHRGQYPKAAVSSRAEQKEPF